MPSLKFLFIAFLSLAFIIKPEPIAKSTCGGYDPDYYDSYEFFAPISIEEFTFDQFYEYNWKWDNTQASNLEEWKEYFEKQATVEDIQKIIYEASSEDIQGIRNYVEGKGSLAKKFQYNSLIDYWQKNRDLEAIDYIFFAKVCEPHAWTQDRWNSKPEKDIQTMRWLVDAGKKYYAEKASNPFLKLRFAYQSIRMAHYVGQYQKAIDYYEELVQPLFEESKSMIRYWALAHQAGAYARLGERAKANYLFSQVFEYCPSKRVSSFLSFEVENGDQWQEMLDLSKNEEEKSNLYFIRSLEKNSLALEEMKQVYQLSPESEKLAIMLVREINQLEYNLLSVVPQRNLLFYRGYQSYPQQEAVKRLIEVKNFISKVRKESSRSDVNLWTLAEGYLDYMIGSPKRALETFAKLKKQSRDASIRKQIEVFETAIQITQLKNINDKVEDNIYKKVKDLDHEKLMDLMVSAFARLYDGQNELGKAYLCRNYVGRLKYNVQLEVVDALIELTNKKNTAFEKEYLLPKVDYRAMDEDSKVKPKHVLLELKATAFFSQDKLKEALNIYESLPEEALHPLDNDPFDIRIQDCYEDCPKSPDAGKYNRKTMVKKMLILKEYVEKASVDRAKYYYQLGAAYYNLSHFGNTWDGIDYYRSSTDLYLAKEKAAGKRLDYEENIFPDCAKSKYYFDRALDIAYTNKDQELAAKACFMAAKCEQNQYYLRPGVELGWDGIIPPSYAPQDRRYFRRLKNDFADTEYYEQAIRECKYFHEFINP